MNKVIICRGIQGSGKSTWAKQWVKEDPNHRIRINQDDFRNMFGVYWLQDNSSNSIREKLTKALNTTALEKAMFLGFNIVIDNMNLNPKTTKEIEDKVNEFNHKFADLPSYEVEYKDFFISVDECIRRDSLRPNPIGEKVIKATYNRYRDMMIHSSITNEIDNWIPNNNNLEDAIIIDLDGTIALNIEGRPFYGEGCAEKIIEDSLIPGTSDLVKSMAKQGYKIIIVTGREGTTEIKEATKNWLAKYDIPYEEIYFRKVKDYSPGPICKENTYNNYIKGMYNIKFVLDDNQRCVDMWRDNGLICLQPNKGNF